MKRILLTLSAIIMTAATMTAQDADKLLHSLSEAVDAADRSLFCCDCSWRIERPFSWEGGAVPKWNSRFALLIRGDARRHFITVEKRE